MTKLEKEALLKPEQLEKLKELFPQAVVDGKVDFVLLKALLGEQVEGSNEKYQFTWNGKQNAIANAQKPSPGTLREDKASSKNFDSTENLYIEGDNLEVLKLLQKTYQGKIKMIYIDPPYNTGNDFVYKDDFKDNIKNYLELTNQKNKSNAETSGRYHTDWLNMMYPRLMLSRNLLTDDGVILISIDDREFGNLLKISEEIFTLENIEVFVWKKKSGSGNTEKILGVLTEYIIACFRRKKPGDFNYKKIERTYNFYDSKGPFNLEGIEKTNQGTYERPTMLFKIVDPKTEKEFHPSVGMRWTIGNETVNNYLQNGKLFFDYKTNKVKVIKRPEDYENSENVYYNLLDNEGSLGEAKNELYELLGNRELFDTPKPLKLLLSLGKISSNRSDLILDFFSGSGTTAHAVMKLNSEDGGNRKFIMVQLPEKTEEDSEAYKAGYKNICEIGKERIRRAGEKVKQEMLEKDPSADVSNLDVGFKVFKLDSTNIKPWDGTQDIQQSLLEASGNVVKEDRTDLDVIHELMLMYGVFNEDIEEVKINGKTLYSIGNHFLVVCLFKTITKLDIEAIIKLKPKNVIFNDAGFENDNVKINAELTLKNYGVEDIKSL